MLTARHGPMLGSSGPDGELLGNFSPSVDHLVMPLRDFWDTLLMAGAQSPLGHYSLGTVPSSSVEAADVS